MSVKTIFISEILATEEQSKMIRTILENHMYTYNDLLPIVTGTDISFKDTMKLLGKYLVTHRDLLVYKPALFTEIKHMRNKWIKRKFYQQKFVSEIQYMAIQPQYLSFDRSTSTLSIKWLDEALKLSTDLSEIDIPVETHVTISASFTGKIMVKAFVVI